MNGVGCVRVSRRTDLCTQCNNFYGFRSSDHEEKRTRMPGIGGGGTRVRRKRIYNTLQIGKGHSHTRTTKNIYGYIQTCIYICVCVYVCN